MACAAASYSETSSWSTTFPSEISTFLGSSLYVKRLMAVAISNITYLRAIFPESAYGTRKLADIDLKILSDSTSCTAARQLTQWVKACFEALDRKYLRQLMLGIHATPGDRDNVIESYTFQFSYTTDGASVTCNGQEVARSTNFDTQMTRKATAALLRTLVIITQTLEPLPDNSFLTIKLLYYDDVTPADYEPEGFVPAKTDKFFFSGSSVSMEGGTVSTPFHSVKVRVRAEQKQADLRDEEPMPSGSITVQSSCRSQNSGSLFEGENMDNINKTVNREEYATHNTDESMVVGPSDSASVDHKPKGGKASETNDVRCPCGSQQEEGLMILCTKCDYWQHGVCFGVLEETEASENHVCNLCYKTSGGQCELNDEVLYNLTDVNLQAFCLWRRALLSVCDMKVLRPSALAKRLQIENSLAVSIIHRMEKEGYVTTGSGRVRGKKCVNRSFIMKDGIPKYIKKNTKAASDYKDASVEELNTKTGDLHLSGIPKVSAAYQRYEQKHDKENHQHEQLKAESSKPVMEPDSPVFYSLRGRKRSSEVHQR